MPSSDPSRFSLVAVHAQNPAQLEPQMRVTARYRVDGSVLNDTVQSRMLGAETTLEIDSPDPPERVAKVVRNAERGCFVLQALQNPVPVTGRTLLNGSPLVSGE